MSDLKSLLTELESLPEGITSEALTTYWRRLLDLWDSGELPACDFCDCFYELANRQWHSYEPVARITRERLDAWVHVVWNVTDTEILDCCVAVIGNVGLDASVELIHSAIENPALKLSLRNDLKRELVSWGEQPLDPWSGMPGRQKNDRTW